MHGKIEERHEFTLEGSTFHYEIASSSLAMTAMVSCKSDSTPALVLLGKAK